MNDVVSYEQRDAAAWLTISRPEKLNALSYAVVDGLREGIRRAAEDDSVKVLVLTGAGGTFSSGYDLSEEVADGIHTAEDWHRLLTKDVAVTMELWGVSKPTIAAVHGWCLAGGCELAMACDMIVATSEAKFGEPEIRYGSGPVTLLMPFLLGEKKTAELLFTGDVIDAVEAERLGLVNCVVAPEALEARVEELIAKIAPTPLEVLKYTKLGLVRAYEAMGLREAVSSNLEVSAILNSADTEEQRTFDEIAGRDGLKAALAWRDSRYGGALSADGKAR